MDVHSPQQRSFNMSRIKGKNTSPEMKVRRLLHSLGYRYRLHVRDLAGRPDIVLPKHRVVIFVHGCFWHMHKCRFGRVTPKTNAEFWQKKRTGNVERDRKQRRILRKDWTILTVWECQTRDVQRLASRLTRSISPQM
jgi:DNA mismatch endonuclease (patch repair protein)